MTATPAGRVSIAPGFDRVESFGDPQAEYLALRGGAALVDRSARLRMLFAGAQAAQTVSGLITNDVQTLASGGGLYAAALTPKGRIIADVRVFVRADDFLLDAPDAAGAGFMSMTRKYVNPRLASYADVRDILRAIGVFGPRAAAVIAAVLDLEERGLLALPLHHHLRAVHDGAGVMVARVADLGVDGFELFVPVEVASSLWSRLEQAGARPAGSAVAEIARVEAGRPAWGVDMDDETLVQEANLDRLDGVSWTKGCYTGQEVVARVHFRGHVNRRLRGLRSPAPLSRGAQLFTATGDPCGDVRSAVVSPRLGPLAIAMLRREIEARATLTARWTGAESEAEVCELPFG